MFSNSTMSIVEGLSLKDPKIVESLLLDLLDPEKKAYCLSFLPEEIVSVYPALSPPTLLSTSAANRAYNALALLQTIAGHDTWTQFLAVGIPLQLFSIVNTTSEAKTFEYLCVTSLGVLGALGKVDYIEVFKFLLKSEVSPLCLRIMGTGNELSKRVATFIAQKIMLDEVGLQYICATVERFFQAASVLANMVIALTKQPYTELLKHVIFCYLGLTYDPRACNKNLGLLLDKPCA